MCELGRTERKRLDLYPRSFQARAGVGQLQGPQGPAQAHSRGHGEDRKGLGEQACSARKSTIQLPAFKTEEEVSGGLILIRIFVLVVYRPSSDERFTLSKRRSAGKSRIRLVAI
jgi:hypothetical protein